MKKFKYILVLFSIVLLASCGSDSGTTPFDHEAQALIDKDSIADFLAANYYDATVDSIKPLVAGQTALVNDSNLKSEDITFNDINYTMYYYLNSEGADPAYTLPNGTQDRKGFPTKMDTVVVKYGGVRSVEKDSLSSDFDRGTGARLSLAGVLAGWS